MEIMNFFKDKKNQNKKQKTQSDYIENILKTYYDGSYNNMIMDIIDSDIEMAQDPNVFEIFAKYERMLKYDINKN